MCGTQGQLFFDIGITHSNSSLVLINSLFSKTPLWQAAEITILVLLLLLLQLLLLPGTCVRSVRPPPLEMPPLGPPGSSPQKGKVL